MRITKLAIAGFGPYKDEQVVDFRNFGDDGLFLITGKTGAGKSSILDAICFALYGSIPRYEGTQQRLRSDHCAPEDLTFVELEFAVGNTEYRVRRTPEYERPKKHGEGTTSEKATAELFVRTGDEWEGIAARSVDVGHELTNILGLTKDQFLQVILLAQNRFQEFLLAKNDDRQDVLRTLFGTRRFASIEKTLDDRRRAFDDQIAATRDALSNQVSRAATLLAIEDAPVDPGFDWFTQELAELVEHRIVAVDAASAADAVFTAADVAHRALEKVGQLQGRRDSATAQLAALESQREARTADRVAVEAAGRASIVWAHISASDEASHTLKAAQTVEDEARAEYAQFGSVEVTRAALTGEIESLTRQLGSLEPAARDELTLPALSAKTEELKNALADAGDALSQAESRIAEVPPQLQIVGERIADAQVRAAATPAATGHVERLMLARKAAKASAALEEKYSKASIIDVEATGAHANAASRVHDLMKQRLAGHAAELAEELVEGQPCAVCGSVTHPAPAETDAIQVTEEDVELARSKEERLRIAKDAAHQDAQNLATQLTEERTRADNKSAEQLESELAAASSSLEAAQAAVGEVQDLEAEQLQLRKSLAADEAALVELRAAKDETAALFASKVSEHLALESKISEYRAGYGTVADRVRQSQAHLDAAKTLSDALTQTRTSRKAAKTATSILQQHLKEQLFADEDAAVAARVDQAELASISVRIRKFDDGVASAKATLADIEIAGLAVEPIDMEPLNVALATARTVRDTSLSARDSLISRCEQLATIVDAARKQYQDSEAVREQHAQLRDLASVVQGNEPNEKRMRLETYVLAARLEEIVAAANARLRTMTGGRYTLEHDDAIQFRAVRSGLGLSIRDEHTGRARATHSLSGGETFLASLALALGLAEVVTNQAGGITLDTLFIDEGFGSLDSDTLEIAMSTLDSLRAGGRTIGLISHVDAMKEQIAAKLRITVSEKGHSEIEAAIAA